MLDVIGGDLRSQPPVWLMRQAGRYLPEYRAIRQQVGNFLDLCYNPDLATEVTLQPIRRFELDAAIIFSDILVIPHALGQSVQFVEGRGPVLEPITDSTGVSSLADKLDPSKVDRVYEALSKTRSMLPDPVTLIGFVGAPWTVATYMVEGGTSRDFATIKSWAFSDPQGFDALIDRLVDASIAHLSGQIEAGAEVVQLFESWAGILPPFAFKRWCVQPVRQIVSTIKQRYPNVPVVGFPRGAGVALNHYAQDTGVDVMGLDSTVSAEWASKALSDEVVLQGNLDPIALIAGGATMRDGVAEILNSFRGKRFIFNLGHGVLPTTPIEHVSELMTLLRSGNAS